MLQSDELERRRQIAESIAREAGQYVRRQFENLDTLTVEKKGQQDFVSEADRNTELQLRQSLETAFPDDGFLGEESGGDVQEPLWVIDPIDGTTNFLRGFPMFGISMAWVAEGASQVGVIYEPATKRMFSATRTGPATLNGKPLQIRECHSLDTSIVAFGYSERSGREEFLERLTRVLRAHAEFRRLGAATAGLMAVASGQADAFFQMRLSPWDVLAGLLIAERAGAVAHNFLAHDGLRQQNYCFCAAPGISDELEKLLDVTSITPKPLGKVDA